MIFWGMRLIQLQVVKVLKAWRISSLSEMDTRHFNISTSEKQEFLEDVNTELSVYFGMLYFLIEAFKNDEEFGEELSTWTITC